MTNYWCKLEIDRYIDAETGEQAHQLFRQQIIDEITSDPEALLIVDTAITLEAAIAVIDDLEAAIAGRQR